jgi:cell division protein FtsW
MISYNRADTSVVGKWWSSVDRLTLLALGVLLGIGYVMALAAIPSMSMRLTDPHMQAMLRQIVFLLLGGATMLRMSMFSLREVKLYAFGIGIVFFFLTGFTLVHGTEVDGANRWLSLPGFTIQPSEFLRPAFIIVSAWLIAEPRRTPGFPGQPAALGLFVANALLLHFQPDFGMTALFTVVLLVQLYFNGMGPRTFGVLLLLAAAGGLYEAIHPGHVHERVMMFIHAMQQHSKAGHHAPCVSQACIALSAFGHGGLTGLGPGEGQVVQHLPDARADFVFAVAGEEFGLLFCGFIIAIFLAIVLRAFNRLLDEPDIFVVLAAGGLTAGFGLQAFVNMASALSLIPTKGMTLPFISYGGSSVLAISVQMGFLLALTRKRFGENA